MWQKTKRFLRETDTHGSPIMQNMNGMKTIGTVIGGVLSISSMIFFTIFISAQIYLWLF